MKYHQLDTPSLLIDREILLDNLKFMQEYANRNGIALRPHTKTHKMPYIAKLQIEMGASGIAVAKIGEAEIMAEHGVEDIFIANEIIGDIKYQRICKLSEKINLSFGVDTPCQVEAAELAFKTAQKPAQVLIEIEVGEKRSGIIEESKFVELLEVIKTSPHVHFKGIFSHDGHSYSASNVEECCNISLEAQRRTLRFAEIAREHSMIPEIVSIGSTPPQMNQCEILSGITEIRPGTYALMDASQGNAIGSHKRCAATILASVISCPTSERVILDVGAKGITSQERTKGICAVTGKGLIIGYSGVYIDDVYDEHGIIYNRGFREAVQVGDKVRIIPVHICPVCNLYEIAVLISDDEVVQEIPILCRGKLQ